MYSIMTVFILMFDLLFLAVGGYVVYLIIKALKTYIITHTVSENKKDFIKSLGENIKHYRTESKMTQEFVAESIGVSRQSVSKWENGVTDPSTSNLISLSELFNIEVQDLLN